MALAILTNACELPRPRALVLSPVSFDPVPCPNSSNAGSSGECHELVVSVAETRVMLGEQRIDAGRCEIYSVDRFENIISMDHVVRDLTEPGEIKRTVRLEPPGVAPFDDWYVSCLPTLEG